MAREHGPYSVAFPVDFTSKGDTTRDAFRKHMDEITRIYGILTGLDADTLDSEAVSEMLQKHVNSTNPHPNWKPSLSFTDITGSLDASRLTGNIDASKVKGALTGATIAADKVTGLSAFVDGKNKGDGISEANLSDKGYAKFNNGLIVQWGVSPEVTSWENDAKLRNLSEQKTVSYFMNFPSKCLALSALMYFGDITNNGRSISLQVDEVTKSEFKYRLYGVGTDFHSVNFEGKYHVKYIAIGV